MLLALDTLPEQALAHFNGGEGTFYMQAHTDSANRILRGRLEPGASIGMHTHETSSEILYILEGSGKMLFDDTEERLSAGLCHYCPKGHRHSLINDGDAPLLFFAVVPQQ